MISPCCPAAWSNMINVFRTPFFLPRLYPTLLWRNSPDLRDIFLTFDDGPIPAVTEFVLDTLQPFGAKATFFCIGDNVRKHPGVFQRIVTAGHRVGNHTFHHVKGWQTPDVQYLEEVRQCDAEMAKHGVSTELFRPPYGRIKRSQIRALGSRKIVMWDVLTNDYDRSLSEEDCLAGTLSATRSGSIVVFHDSLKAERNLRYVLPRYLEYLAAGGYQFKTL